MVTMPAAACRAFDMGEGDTYLNAAGRSALLRSAHEAACEGVAMKLRPWHFGDADHVDRAKELFARHLQCLAANVALVPSAAYAVSTVAANVVLREGEQIVVTEDHYASVLPWQHRADRSGATVVAVRHLRPPHASLEGGSTTAAILDKICERTAVVSAPPCCWTDGELIDLGLISAACRRVGAALVVDATQWVGAMPFSVGGSGEAEPGGQGAQPDAVIV